MICFKIYLFLFGGISLFRLSSTKLNGLFQNERLKAVSEPFKKKSFSQVKKNKKNKKYLMIKYNSIYNSLFKFKTEKILKKIKFWNFFNLKITEIKVDLLPTFNSNLNFFHYFKQFLLKKIVSLIQTQKVQSFPTD